MNRLHASTGGYVTNNPAVYSNITTTWKDLSPNNFSLTTFGGYPATQTLGSMPYGNPNWRGQFNRPNAATDNGGGLIAPVNSAFDLGTGDYTQECWFNTPYNSGAYGLISIANNTGWGSAWLGIEGSTPSSKLMMRATGRTTGADASIVASVVYNINVWNHAAVTRQGSTFRLFLNGVQVGSATSTASLKTGCNCYIGSRRDSATNGYYGGLMRDVRIVKGTALYTANFTPPNAPLVAVPGTVLLIRFNEISNKGVKLLGYQNPYNSPIDFV